MTTVTPRGSERSARSVAAPRTSTPVLPRGGLATRPARGSERGPRRHERRAGPGRVVALALLLGCAHARPVADDVVPGQLLVVTEGPATEAEVLALVADATLRVSYVAAASPTTHLVAVARADGSPVDRGATEAARAALAARPGVRAVELNRLRRPR